MGTGGWNVRTVPSRNTPIGKEWTRNTSKKERKGRLPPVVVDRCVPRRRRCACGNGARRIVGGGRRKRRGWTRRMRWNRKAKERRERHTSDEHEPTGWNHHAEGSEHAHDVATSNMEPSLPIDTTNKQMWRIDASEMEQGRSPNDRNLGREPQPHGQNQKLTPSSRNRRTQRAEQDETCDRDWYASEPRRER